ncbi:MAG: hypothetical protein J0I18_03460 [Actinobacteria bacterium]|nr:hypothetical protein [Actinomycetota bacterium]
MIIQYVPSGLTKGVSAKLFRRIHPFQQGLRIALTWREFPDPRVWSTDVDMTIWDIDVLTGPAVNTSSVLVDFVCRLVSDNTRFPSRIELLCLDERTHDLCERSRNEFERGLTAATRGSVEFFSILDPISIRKKTT